MGGKGRKSPRMSGRERSPKSLAERMRVLKNVGLGSAARGGEAQNQLGVI